MGFSEEIICVFSYPVSVRAYWPPDRMTLNVNDLELVVNTNHQKAAADLTATVYATPGKRLHLR